LNAKRPSNVNRILRYLHDTIDIRYKQKFFRPLNGGDSENQLCIIPWSLDAVSINTQIEPDNLRDLIQYLGFLEIDHERRYGMDFELIKLSGGGNTLPSFEREIFEFPRNLAVSSAINTYIYGYLMKRIDEEKTIIPIEDAIFSLKNTILIPDDFIPDYIMSSVEGGDPINTSTVFREIQPFAGQAYIYIFPEFTGERNSRIRFLYPSTLGWNDSIPSLDTFLSLIGDSFRKLQEDPDYRSFELSRCLKDVIYSVEIKHTRMLNPPLFSSDKIALLKTVDILENSDKGEMLKKSISLDELRSMRDELKNNVMKLSRSWLQRTIDLNI